MKICYLILFAAFFFLHDLPVIAQAGPPKPRDTTISGSQTFAMIMGISKYKYVRPLSYADKDAEMFRDFLMSPAGGSVSADNIFCLLNEQALSTMFWAKGFKWLDAKKLRDGDKLFIYLAGHGDAIDEDQFFYIAYDCNPAGDKNNYLAGGVIQLYNLKLKIQRETGKGVEVFFIMDACRTNELPGGKEGQNFLNSAISEKRAGEIIMLATGAGQESLEDESIGNGHGLFTYYLVNGLTGEADVQKDNKVSLSEIQQYIHKNVPAIAQQVFKRKQDPYFCCNENSEKIITVVDTAYLRRWLIEKKTENKGPGNSAGAFTKAKKENGRGAADTLLIDTYNLFNKAVRESRLTGRASAEYYYDMMARKYPGDAYTIDAQTTLAVEFINFAQTKINLYLDCKDAASIQRLRVQAAEEENSDDLNSTLLRMEKVAQQEFHEVGEMLEKAISYIMPDDPVFARSLMGRMNFFKARGYFGRSRQKIDIRTAFQFAYSAYASDRNASYILNTLSSLHLDNNNYDSAIYYAKRAITTAPKWRYPYVTLAYSYKTLNKRDSAVKYYRRAIAADPGNADAYVDLGHFYYAISKPDSAIANYEKALRIDPANVYASNNIGWLFLDQKKYDNAVPYFKKSIQIDPKLINAYNGLAKTFFYKKEYDSARIYYRQAFANYPDKSIVNVYVGNFYRDLGEYDSAKVYYRNAVELDPQYEVAFNNLGQASFLLKQYDSARYYYKRALGANPYSAHSLINLGIVFKEVQQPDSAYAHFQRAIQLEPGNPAIFNNVGTVYAGDKNYDSAKAYFRSSLQIRPDYKPAFNNMVKLFRQLGQLDSVTNFLMESTTLNPGSSVYMNEVGLSFLDQRKYDSARKYFRMGLEKEPFNPQLLNNTGLAFQGMRRYDSARIYFFRAIEQAPESPVYSGNMANMFRQQKQYDSAVHYYKKQVLRWIEPDPVDYAVIGGYYDEFKMYDSAIAYFRKAIMLDRNYANGYSRIGGIYLVIDLNDSALVYLKKAVELDPNSPTSMLNLGLTYRAMQQYDSAIVYLEESTRLDPLRIKSYFQLGCTYALQGKSKEAIVYLQRAYELGYKGKEDLLTDPDLMDLKKDKDFQKLLDKYLPGWKSR